MPTPKVNSKQKCVKRHKNHEKGDCYYTTRLTGWLTRRGELGYSQWRAKGEQLLLSVTHLFAVASWVVSKHCSLSRCSSPWRADYSPWRVMTSFCREVRFFTPKTQFSSNPIPNLIGNSTCDDSIT